MTLPVTVETGDMTQVFASPTGSADNVRGIDIGGWGGVGVVLSLLMLEVAMSLFLLPILLVGGLGVQKRKGCEGFGP